MAMKVLGFILLLTSVIACDPYGFGYKKNPAYVLDEAFKAVSNLDVESFTEVTAKEALCIYGNEQGLLYLKDKLQLNLENLKLNPKVLESKHFTNPVYTGFWSYYHERYGIEVTDKALGTVLFETIVDCDFGTEGEKNDALINKAPSSYRKKECRAVKLIPKNFPGKPAPVRCGPLRIDL